MHLSDFFTVAAPLLNMVIVTMDGVDVTLGTVLAYTLIFWLLIIGVNWFTGGRIGGTGGDE